MMRNAFLLAVTLLMSVAIGHAAEESICSDANVLFCDNFNDRTLGDINTYYNPSTNFQSNLGGKTLAWGNNNIAANTGQRVTNVGCLEGNCFAQDYVDLSSPIITDNGGGGFIGSANFAQNRTIYYRMFVKYPTNWVNSQNGSKLQYISGGVGYGPRQLFEVGTPSDPFPMMERIFNPTEGRAFANMNLSEANLHIGQWMCFETRATHESVYGAHDGYWQSWINDVQVAEYPNIAYNAGGGNDTQSATTYDNVLLSAYWNCVCPSGIPNCNGGQTNCADPANAHPTMTRLIDRVVVSKARIGCGGAIPPTPPAAPTGLRFASLILILAAAGAWASLHHRVGS